MANTAQLLLEELEDAAKDLLLRGEHEGSCTNENQMRMLPKVNPCYKHEAAQKRREERFKRALEQFRILRNMFDTQGEIV